MPEFIEEQPAQQFDMARYLDIARRRHMYFLVPLFLGWALVWGASWVLPARYKSTTTILVEQPSMPKNYVVPNITDDLQTRLQSIQQQILSPPGRDHPPGREPRVRRGDHQHRQQRRAAVFQRDPARREPQIALCCITWHPGQPVRRIRAPVLRPQPCHVLPEPRRRSVPAGPLCEHRRGHLRELRQQLPYPRLERIKRRRDRPALILRRQLRGDRPRDRRPADTQLMCHLPLRNPVSHQPADQRPILHRDHPANLSGWPHFRPALWPRFRAAPTPDYPTDGSNRIEAISELPRGYGEPHRLSPFWRRLAPYTSPVPVRRRRRRSIVNCGRRWGSPRHTARQRANGPCSLENYDRGRIDGASQ